ncbi:MAG: ABC-ATPase domain-containing protein [Lachnospiraceae bacterium]|nr:ABC-ATPase domain-containing protein [Lachnospiraceae bacterium]
MNTSTNLRNLLASVNHKSYPAYKSLQGQYNFGDYTLCIDHVQGDPFAAPSKLRILMRQSIAGFPADYYSLPDRKIALEDYIIRLFGAQAAKYTFKAKGSGKSGLISVSRPGQEILERTACNISGQQLEMRFEVGFPANGRNIQSDELAKIFFDFLPAAVNAVFYYKKLNAAAVKAVIELADDQAFIRKELARLKLAAFVADGSILPRESGVSERPMKGAVPFASPESLSVTLNLPHKGALSGMGIPNGITLIVGGGYHGKSTLLEALELGVYNHIAGDGREYVITDSSAVKIRAEDGRSIRGTNISYFINNLPNKKDTVHFYTEDASGSTSQAACVVEAIEAGSRLLLIDEDTSATNFMVRDELMQRVIRREQEPITPFINRIRPLYEEHNVSTILVAGSSGDFFLKADTILQMDTYRPYDITEKAKKMSLEFYSDSASSKTFANALSSFRPDAEFPKHSEAENPSAPVLPGGRTPVVMNSRRILLPGSFEKKRDRLKIKCHGKDSIQLGFEDIDLRYVEQIADYEQTNSLAYFLRYADEQLLDGTKDLNEVVKELMAIVSQKGLSALSDSSYLPDFLAMPRIQEVYACFNRCRSLKIKGIR